MFSKKGSFDDFLRLCEITDLNVQQAMRFKNLEWTKIRAEDLTCESSLNSYRGQGSVDQGKRNYRTSSESLVKKF